MLSATPCMRIVLPVWPLLESKADSLIWGFARLSGDEQTLIEESLALSDVTDTGDDGHGNCGVRL